MISVMLNSCIKDPCQGVFCFERGECINGACACDYGYTTEDCTQTFAGFVSGSYQVSSNCIDSVYLAEISVNDEIEINRGIEISNIKNLNNDWSFEAELLTDAQIVFESTSAQVLTDDLGNEFLIETNGLGIYDSLDLNWVFSTTYIINGIQEMCEEVYTLIEE